jgi:uncharacterized protein YbjT (DUF2867 family)
VRVVIFGATGMVGQGVLRECLHDRSVDAVLVVGRSPTGQTHPKLHEVVHTDFSDFSVLPLDGYDACFFCLGVSAAAMSEKDYRAITYDTTIAAARAMFAHNPTTTFIYVSGQGTSEQGRAMWARVKGETERALLEMSPHTYMFRPGFIQPMHGARSKTPLYAWTYRLATPLLPILRRLFPSSVTTTERVGQAMIRVANGGFVRRVLETKDINAVATEELPPYDGRPA